MPISPRSSDGRELPPKAQHRLPPDLFESLIFVAPKTKIFSLASLAITLRWWRFRSWPIRVHFPLAFRSRYRTIITASLIATRRDHGRLRKSLPPVRL